MVSKLMCHIGLPNSRYERINSRRGTCEHEAHGVCRDGSVRTSDIFVIHPRQSWSTYPTFELLQQESLEMAARCSRQASAPPNARQECRDEQCVNTEMEDATEHDL
jgi:hypothetical protein